MNHLLAASPHLAVIPTLTALAIRHLKHKQGPDDGSAELAPKHPAVKFVLGAWNEGDFSDADNHIAPDMEIYTNGLLLSSEHDGPAMARQSIGRGARSRRTCGWNSPQEISEKQRIAIESGSPEPTPVTPPSCQPATGRSTSRAPRS